MIARPIPPDLFNASTTRAIDGYTMIQNGMWGALIERYWFQSIIIFIVALIMLHLWSEFCVHLWKAYYQKQKDGKVVYNDNHTEDRDR